MIAQKYYLLKGLWTILQDRKWYKVTTKKQMDKQLFFHGPKGIRGSLFKHGLKASQIKGFELIIDKFTEWYPDGTIEQLAYILATAHHETGGRMEPILETFAKSRALAARKLERAWHKGQLPWVKQNADGTFYWTLDEGYHWVGAGYVQLTHKANYRGRLRDAVLEKFGPDKDIGQNPDLVLEPEISAYILIEGMMRGDTGIGDFTSHALEDHVNSKKVDFYNARAVVNPGDYPTYKSIQYLAQAYDEALGGAL